MKRFLPGLIGLAVGLGLALLYTWVISPVQYIDTAPNSLRADYQAAYAQTAARAYAVDGDLGRARTRLALLGMRDPAQNVAALATRAAASGGDQAGARALAALASALQGNPTIATNTALAAESPTPEAPADETPARDTPAAGSTAGATPTSGTPAAGVATSAAMTAHPSASSSAAPPASATATARPSDTVVPSITPRLLPTRTPTPTQLAAFIFVGREQVCDPKLGQPLIEVVTENADGQQISGVEVIVTWDAGFDHFFTGLKPDLGAGYGDFTMTAGVAYSVHLAESPAVSIDNLSAEDCSGAAGARYAGSWLLIFKQPR